jgi:hypothetical protein
MSLIHNKSILNFDFKGIINKDLSNNNYTFKLGNIYDLYNTLLIINVLNNDNNKDLSNDNNKDLSINNNKNLLINNNKNLLINNNNNNNNNNTGIKIIGIDDDERITNIYYNSNNNNKYIYINNYINMMEYLNILMLKN